MEITKSEESEVFDPIFVKINSLSQLYPGSRKIPIRTGSEKLKNLLLGLEELSEFSFFHKTRLFNRNLVDELAWHFVAFF